VIVGARDAQRQIEVRLPSGQSLRCRRAEAKAGEGNVEVMFRPELVGVRLNQGGGEAGTSIDGASVNSLQGRVDRVDFTGDHLKVLFHTADGEVTAKLPPDVILPKGGEVTLTIKVENCVAQ
jgi:ABC-type sugar transport system ATPase subunit